MGSPACCLPAGISSHPSQPALLLQTGDEARWLGGAPPRGSRVVFITGASSECPVSKRLFLFSPECSFIPSLQLRCSRHGEEQGLPGSRPSQIWDPKLQKATEAVSEGSVGSVSSLVRILWEMASTHLLASSVGQTESVGSTHGIRLNVLSSHPWAGVRWDDLFSNGIVFVDVSIFFKTSTMCACPFSCLKITGNRFWLCALGIDTTVSHSASDNRVCSGF